MELEEMLFVRGGICLLVDGDRANSWLPGLEPDELAIKNYMENEGMLAFLIKHEIVFPPHRTIQSGHVIFPIVRLIK